MFGVRAAALAIGLSTVCWLLLAAGASAAPPARLYVALGDSVTQLGSDQRYPERFFAFLRAGGAADALENVGVSGETSSSILGGQLGRALVLIDDPGTDTTVVTVDIGGNDLLGSPSCNPFALTFSLADCQPMLQAFSANFDSLLDALGGALAADPGGEQLIVMAYYNPWSGRTGQETVAANAALAMLGSDGQLDCAAPGGPARGLNDLVGCLGAAHGAKLADVYPAFVGHGSDWFADVIHPNAAGHAAIAAVFADVFLRATDTAPPRITVPPTVRVDATSVEGALVSYRVAVSDERDPSPTVSCSPPAGAAFAIGRTTVWCTATDTAGNVASAAFMVVVRGARAQLQRLIRLLHASALPARLTRRLEVKLRQAQLRLHVGDRSGARRRLTASSAWRGSMPARRSQPRKQQRSTRTRGGFASYCAPPPPVPEQEVVQHPPGGSDRRTKAAVRTPSADSPKRPLQRAGRHTSEPQDDPEGRNPSTRPAGPPPGLCPPERSSGSSGRVRSPGAL